MRLKDKVAIITGSGRGIGRATAILFAREGARVTVSCRTESEGKAVADEIRKEGGRALFVKCDISHEPDTVNLVERTVEEFGKLNILVNNAAAFGGGSVLTATPQEYDRIFGVNVKGTGLCSKAAIPYLRRSGNGAIVNISSMSGVIGQPGLALYCASKAAIISLTKSTAIDCPDLRVNAVLAGLTRTLPVDEALVAAGMTLEKGYQHLADSPEGPLMGRVAEPMEIACGILFLASDEASYATGSCLLLDGGVVGVKNPANL